MEIVKLKPYMKEIIWGGNTLREYGKDAPLNNIAECWELSFNKEGRSLIDSGSDKGKEITEVVKTSDLGKNVSKFQFFPTLIKLIDADKNLSIQVHPSDEYALKYENSYGKTEMWYILEAKDGAGIYLGFNKDISKEEIKERIANNTLEQVLNFVPVQSGDCYFIESGTVHAIGGGITLFEVQQNSAITYRLYDWGKLDKNGKPRELHIDKALDVMNLNKYSPVNRLNDTLGECDYFKTYKHKVVDTYKLERNDDSFMSITFIKGNGTFNNIEFNKGDTFFIPISKEGIIKGECEFLLTKI